MGYDVCEEYLHLIKERIKQSDYEDAITGANRLLAYKPDVALAYYYRGLAHYAVSDFTTSVDDYRESLKINPDFPKAIFNMGLAKYRLGFMAEALEDIRAAQIMFSNDNELEAVKKCTNAILILGSEDKRS